MKSIDESETYADWITSLDMAVSISAGPDLQHKVEEYKEQLFGIVSRMLTEGGEDPLHLIMAICNFFVRLDIMNDQAVADTMPLVALATGCEIRARQENLPTHLKMEDNQ